MHEYAKMCFRYNIPNTVNNITTNIIDNIYTHSMQGFTGYIKQGFYSSTNKVGQLQTAIYAQDLDTKHYLYADKCAHFKFQLQ